MFYHSHDDNIARLIKHSMCWVSLAALFLLVVFLIRDDAKIPQKEIILKIDVKNKVNICLPEDDEFSEKSFFDF